MLEPEVYWLPICICSSVKKQVAEVVVRVWIMSTLVTYNQCLIKTAYLLDYFLFLRTKASSFPKGIINHFRGNGFHFQNKLTDSQCLNEKAIACDNLILVSRLARLGLRLGRCIYCPQITCWRVHSYCRCLLRNSFLLPVLIERRETVSGSLGTQ